MYNGHTHGCNYGIETEIIYEIIEYIKQLFILNVLL